MILTENTDFEAGVALLIDKPLEWTSFDVVNKIRGLLNRKLGKKLKVGHAGTLDPLATGLLIVCTGKFTKRIDNFMSLPKEYTCDIKLGATTPSFDLETEIDHEYPTSHITKDMLCDEIDTFIGDTEQTPPIFSAKKINGKKAYELARKGEKAEMRTHIISISEFELLNFADNVASTRILCSKGTYIRSLAYDLGKKLDSGAHLTSLRRTAIGDYHVNDAISINTFENYLSLPKQI
ncbi:tRNA pseudouridine(55) synthase TruB [Bacteroidales bacterium]|nr:tRNA pseudouridine(55) synthase TruB [Bacteroidales bacterium]